MVVVNEIKTWKFDTDQVEIEITVKLAVCFGISHHQLDDLEWEKKNNQIVFIQIWNIYNRAKFSMHFFSKAVNVYE